MVDEAIIKLKLTQALYRKNKDKPLHMLRWDIQYGDHVYLGETRKLEEHWHNLVSLATDLLSVTEVAPKQL